jgi:acetoacetate decarboxylase
MTYPPAPWQLQGYALKTIQLVDVERASNLVPSEIVGNKSPNLIFS